MKVLDNLESFEGRSKFTTWAHKIAIRTALTELRRKRWEDQSLEALTEAEGSARIRLLEGSEADPDLTVEQRDMLTQVQRIIDEALTEKQRTAMVALKVHGMPIAEVARRMGTNRNALYKLVYDARLRLKERMVSEGLSPEEVLAAFEGP
jgi:RNA polymerase sigma-70 factor (ECF subfamily)